jgi:protoporphyrinogen oxidase
MNPDWRRLDREPIGPFLRRHGGRRLFEKIWEPLLLAKLGRDYDRFAASFIWATVARMLSARKAKGRSEKLGFVRGRYGRVLVALRNAIEAHGGCIETGHAVESVEPQGDAWRVHVDGQWRPASAVILCIPVPIARGLLAAVPDAASKLGEVDYLGVICQATLLRRSVTPYYVLNLTDRSLPFTGVIETSNLTGPDEYDGRHLIYLPRYRSQDSPDWEASDADILADNWEGLRRVQPDLRPDDVIGSRVFRARFVQPVHPVGYGDRLPPLELRPGLAYLSTAQIHPWPVFNDEVVRHVDRSLPQITRSWTPSTPASVGGPA